MERKDPMYRASVDAEGEQIDAETVKDVLNFVDATMDEGTEMAEVALEMKEGLAVEVGMETEVKQGDPVVQMVRELNRVGDWHPRAMQTHHGFDVRGGVPGLRVVCA